MDYKRINTIVGWMVFIFATTVYFMTLEPTTSLWDCGEYITTAYKLEVGHPPGAPLFMMLGRLFTMFTGPESAAMMVNAMSALSSSFTILFLFWTITMLAKKAVQNPGDSIFSKSPKNSNPDSLKATAPAPLTQGQQWAILGSGLIGAIAYTFSDSFWFSAVEGEVYAMSSFFTAIVVWAIFKWDAEVAEQEINGDLVLGKESVVGKNPDRWIVLIFFMIGLSIGVHLLNLLCIPVLAYVIYFRKFKKPTVAGFLLTGIIGVVTLGIIQSIVIPYTVQLAGGFERFFVNSIGAGFNVGTVFFFILMLSFIAALLIYSKKNGSPVLNTITWSASMIFLGYSCFAMIVIRSNANTPLDENDPENLVSLEAYLKREQYGDWPILRGQYFNSQMNEDRETWGDRSDVYLRRFVVIDKKGNEIKGFKEEKDAIALATKNGLSIKENVIEKYFKTYDGANSKPTYLASDMTFFPRMYSNEPRHISGYKNWSGHTGDRLPTMGENLRYFSNYQVGWMYWRYFMWNFSGRQSDEQGHGNPRDGNWISGLNFIDQHHIGDQTDAPSVITENPGHNKMYMLPLILGLIGFIFMLTKSSAGWWLVMLLFLLTGFAIIIYLNQKPIEPRERDYAYAASFYAFSIWIGMSVLALYDAFKNMVWKELAIIVGSLFLFGIILFAGDTAAGMSFLYMMAVIAVAYAGMIGMREIKMKDNVVAIVAIAITIPVPMLMGFVGWDDHDRSNRYTAQALAENYLNSCDKNAIIFTNGDNDTFPLWYLQEVEGKKTDVRVCNLSLLNTDWYTEQMTRKAYDSEPLPISFTEEQYRQNGYRDYMYVLGTNQLTMGSPTLDPKWEANINLKIESNPVEFKSAFKSAALNLYTLLAGTNFAVKKPDLLATIPTMDSTSNYFTFRNLIMNLLQKGQDYGLVETDLQNIQGIMLTFNDAFDYLPLDYAMEFLADDANLDDRGRGQKLYILPASGFSVKVNKENALKSGIITQEHADRMVDVIRWKMPKTTIFKADLMILDMVAHFDWKRPIYFASSADPDTYLGLDKYFFAEGLVYKLVPVEAKAGKNPNTLGEVNKTRMYENLMNLFKWGNMEKKGVLVDYYTRRLTNNYRVQFSILADAYGETYEENRQKIDIMKQIMASEQAKASDAPIKTPVGTFIPSQIPADIKKAEAAMAEAQKKMNEVLNRGLEVMPHENVPFDKVIPSYVSAYYVAGNEPMAQKYSDQMFTLFEEEINYYLSVKPEFGSLMIDDMFGAYRGIFSLYQSSAIFGTDKTHQEKISADFFKITELIQASLPILQKESPSASQQIDQTFGAFFSRINGQ